jgi:protein ImuB
MPPVVAPCFLAVARPGASEAACRRFAEWCLRWTPRVHVEPALHVEPARHAAPVSHAAPASHAAPPLVLLDLTGCQRVHGGVARVVLRIGRALERRGLPHAIAVAGTGGLAVARATVGMPAAAADALPLAALRLPPAVHEAFAEVHLRTVGELRRIAAASVADRVGPLPAERLAALDHHDGPRAWPFVPVPMPVPIESGFAFAGPCTQPEAVAAALRQAIDGLCAALDRRMRGVRSLEVRVERSRAAPITGTLHFGMPTRDPAHLWSLLAPRLERIDLGDLERGIGVERLLLRVARTGRLPQGMGDLVAGTAPPAAGHAVTERALGELVDQLAARLGAERVGVQVVPGVPRAGGAAGASPRTGGAPPAVSSAAHD